jgi:RNA polymerase sigma-70 factor, ECF subfamily
VRASKFEVPGRSNREPTRMTTQERLTSARLWRRKSSDPMPEEQICDETRHLRARTQEELVTMFSRQIWRFASSQVARREDAEDIVMEVFAAAFSNFSKLERADDQRLWLLAIARKKVADSMRRHYRRAERPYSIAESAATVPASDDMRLATQGALERLPENQRQVLVLKYVNGLSTEEVGLVVRKSPQATNSLLQRAREALREALGPALANLTPEAL